MTTNNANNAVSERKPAYIAFKTFLTAVETLEQALPPVVDRSVWSTFSGGLQSHTLGAFKFLGLIDENGKVQPILEKLVDAKGEARKPIIGELIQVKYAEALQLGQKNASFQQLQDHFRSHGVQGGTLEMVIRFFLDACAYTDLKCSPHWAAAKKTLKRSRKPDGARDDKNPPPPDENSKPGNKTNVKIVQLSGGGTLSMSLSVDLMSLSTEDRSWLFEIIDKLNAYGGTSK